VARARARARTWAKTTLGFARLLRGGRGKARRARGAPECACVAKFLHVRACTVHEYVCTSKTRANAWIWCLKSCTYSTVRVPPTAHGEARKVRGACLTDAHTVQEINNKNNRDRRTDPRYALEVKMLYQTKIPYEILRTRSYSMVFLSDRVTRRNWSIDTCIRSDTRRIEENTLVGRGASLRCPPPSSPCHRAHGALISTPETTLATSRLHAARRTETSRPRAAQRRVPWRSRLGPSSRARARGSYPPAATG